MNSALAALLACAASVRPRDPGADGAAQVAGLLPDASVNAPAPGARVGVASPLHVAVTEAVRGDGQMSPWLRVCPVQGAVFLCGESAIYVQRDGVVARDTTLEAGLARDSTGLFTLIAVYGRWPDNAWLVATDVSQPPPFETTIYRWTGSRWRVAVPGHKSMHSFEVVPWGATGALLVEKTFGTGPSQVTTGIGAQTGRRIPDVEAVAPFNDSVLAVVREPHGRTKTPSLQLWPASRAPLPPLPLLAGVESDAEVYILGITTVRESEIVLYGGHMDDGHGGRQGTKEPYLAHFDGKSLTPLIAPPGAVVTSYVEEPSGIAWALSTRTADDWRSTAWRREVGGPWSAVALPMPYVPDRLTLTDDGAVWMLAFGPVTLIEGHESTGINAALFSTHAPANVLALGEHPGSERR